MLSLLVLSPHRDDAVFSLAMALCYWRGLPLKIKVANFFTHSNYGPHAVNPAETGASIVAELSQQRKREDHRALAMIDRRICVESADLLDAPLRLGIGARSVCNVSEISVRQPDVNLVHKNLEKLTRASAVIAPLGLGNHVDHLTVRAAAMNAVGGHWLAFYEDLPYATWTPESVILERVRGTEQHTRAPLRPVTLRNSCNMRMKRRFSNQYRTQIEPAEASAIAAFASKYGCGERIWIPRHSRVWRALLR